MTEREDLLAGADRLLSEVTEFLSRATVVDSELEQEIALALTIRVLKLAHSAHRLCVADCAVDAEPVARSMLSGTASLIFILDYDVRRRAALFLIDGTKQDRRRLERLLRQGMLTKSAVASEIRKSEAQLKATLASHNLADVNRNKYDTKDTWHGLSERVVFELMGWSDWYDMYAAFSANIHVAASSLKEVVAELEERSIDADRSGGDPYLVMVAMNVAVPQALFQLETLFGWGKRDEIEAIGGRFAAAISAYAKAGLAKTSP